MKKILVILILAMMSSMSSAADKRPVVAVIEFKNTTSVNPRNTKV